jgi:hypothetical protein
VSHTKGISYALELPSVDDRAQPREDPCMALGMAVMRRAWVDALDQIDYLDAGGSSRGWWRIQSRGLQDWCEALGLDIGWVVRRARARFKEYDAGDKDARRRIRGLSDSFDLEADDWEPMAPRQSKPEKCRAYYVKHRPRLLQKRRERYEREQALGRLEERFPGYCARHNMENPLDSAPVQDTK